MLILISVFSEKPANNASSTLLYNTKRKIRDGYKGENILDNWINVGRLILITLLTIYEIWSFINNKTLKRKLLPMILLSTIGLLFIALVPYLGVVGGIFAVLLIELSIISSMLVIAAEVGLILISSRRDLKKVLLLVSSFLLLALIYYLGERVF